MKMYDYPAPNAQKVRIFAYEKNISIEYIPVDLIKHALRTPEMLKKNPLEKAKIQEVDRLAELGLMIELGHHVHNISPFFADKGPQSSEASEMALNCYTKNLDIFEKIISGEQFIIFDRPTVADCTLFSTFTFAESIGVKIQEDYTKLMSWYKKFGERESSKV